MGAAAEPAALCRVVQNWRHCWRPEVVRAKEEFLVPVAVDEKKVPQDWVFVAVRSGVQGERLGDARSLQIETFDAAGRPAKQCRRHWPPLLRRACWIERGVK